jgi:hypothetical protein
MLRDIVVDTNVFVHASNPGVTYYSEANSLVTSLEGSSTSLCVDEGFDLEPTHNRSLIGCEYITHLHFGMPAYALVYQLAHTGRIRIVPRCVTAAIGRKINQIIAIPRDRTFLKVAINSHDHFLCSHDFRHFSNCKRVKVKNVFDVRVKTAGETLLFLGQTDGAV